MSIPASMRAQVLRTDATLEATPFRDWQSGRALCVHILDAYVLGTPGDWRMIATTANGQPAAVVYHRHTHGWFPDPPCGQETIYPPSGGSEPVPRRTL